MGIAGQTPITAWTEQMQTLVDGRPAVLSDHLGVVFLFGNMGINVSYSPRAPVTNEHREYMVGEELRVSERTETHGDEVEEALRVVERKAVEAAVRDIQEQEIALDGYK